MIKRILLILALTIALTLVSCITASEIFDYDTTPTDFEIIEENAVKATEMAIANGVVIYDMNGIKISYLGFDPVGDIWGSEIILYIENNTSIDYLVQTREFHVNDVPFAPLLSCHAPQGEGVIEPLILLRSSVNSTGINVAENVSFRFFFMEKDKPSVTFESDFVTIDLS